MYGTDAPPDGCVHTKVIQSNRAESLDLKLNDKIYRIIETPIFSKAGNVVGYVHRAYDITAQKRAEQQLRESRDQFETIFTKFPIGILIVDLHNGKILNANDYFCEMLNYSKAELTALTFYDITHPDDRQ